ncbi:MAG: hypothetical protein ACYDCH_11345, partial [Gaiellaceae bacterium]
MKVHRRLVFGLFLTGATLAIAAALVTAAANGTRGTQGGILRVAGVPAAIDPAITLDAGDALAASCVRLMSYPDKTAPAGTRVVPEAAAGYPT